MKKKANEPTVPQKLPVKPPPTSSVKAAHTLDQALTLLAEPDLPKSDGRFSQNHFGIVGQELVDGGAVHG